MRNRNSCYFCAVTAKCILPLPSSFNLTKWKIANIVYENEKGSWENFFVRLWAVASHSYCFDEIWLIFIKTDLNTVAGESDS